MARAEAAHGALRCAQLWPPRPPLCASKCRTAPPPPPAQMCVAAPPSCPMAPNVSVSVLHRTTAQRGLRSTPAGPWWRTVNLAWLWPGGRGGMQTLAAASWGGVGRRAPACREGRLRCVQRLFLVWAKDAFARVAARRLRTWRLRLGARNERRGTCGTGTKSVVVPRARQRQALGGGGGDAGEGRGRGDER